MLEDSPRADQGPGIATDVAWRHFETDKRKFMAADAPGHEQDTGTVAMGAASADLAVILVDARKGILTQTRRDSYIVSLMGVRQAVLAVNKMDLAGYAQAVFEAIAEEYAAFAHELGIENVHAIPLSALTGENVRACGGAMPWYAGPTVMEALEGAAPESDSARRFLPPAGAAGGPPSIRTRAVLAAPFPSGGGTIASGRGDVIADRSRPPAAADQFAAHLIWLDGSAMLPGRTYAIRIGTASATAQITDLVHRVDVDTLRHLAAKTLERDEVGYCKLALDQRVAFDPHTENRRTGAFVLIDKFSGATAGMGVIHFPLRRATNVVWQPTRVDRAAPGACQGPSAPVCCGLRVCRPRGNRRSQTGSSKNCMPPASTPICWTATMCGMA